MGVTVGGSGVGVPLTSVGAGVAVRDGVGEGVKVGVCEGVAVMVDVGVAVGVKRTTAS